MRYFLERPKRIIELALSGLVIETFVFVYLHLHDITLLAGKNAFAKFIIAYPNTVAGVLFVMAVAGVANVAALLFHKWKYEAVVRSNSILTQFIGFLFLAFVSWELLGPESLTWTTYVVYSIISAALYLGVRLEKGDE